VLFVGEGDDKKEFTVHRSFAIKTSKFLQATLKYGNGWNTTLEKGMPLPSVTVANFQMYMEWLYTGRVVELDYNKSQASETLVRLYVLRDYLEDDHFSNAIIDTLIQNSSYFASGMVWKRSTVDMAWDETQPESPLRRVLARLIACSVGSHNDWSKSPRFLRFGIWSKEVSAEVFAELDQWFAVQDAIDETVEFPVNGEDKCAYHLRGEGYQKCS
jgi:hypothetical protein